MKNLKGIEISQHSVTELVYKTFIMQKLLHVFTERFCQDPLENYFCE